MLDGDTVSKHMQAMRTLGVPYTDQDIRDAAAQVQGKTEMDAMVAYLQVLGTMAKLDYGVVYRE
jgi:cytochrome c oxidase cbb3-type subunit 2